MNADQLWLVAATVAAALGAWLALGGECWLRRGVGLLLVGAGLVLYAWRVEAVRRPLLGLAERIEGWWGAEPAALWCGGAAALFLLGMYLMLPRGLERGRRRGAALALVAFGIVGWQLPRLVGAVDQGLFTLLAGLTIASAVATVTFRSPVYCAIWFALTLLSVCGLFLYQGAQFLAVATLVVYAGAILVTLLFVLMLAQPEGHSTYDRVSWEAFFSALAGALMLGAVLFTLAGTVGATVEVQDARSPAEAAPSVLREPAMIPPAAAEDLQEHVLHGEHMAVLGRELFGRHLIAVELAGTLLLVALVGAVAIVAQDRLTTVRPTDAPPAQKLSSLQQEPARG